MRDLVLSIMDFSFIRQIQCSSSVANGSSLQMVSHYYIDLVIALFTRLLFPYHGEESKESQYIYIIVSISKLLLDQVVLKCLFKMIFTTKYSFLLSFSLLNIYLNLLKADEYYVNYYYFHVQLSTCFIYEIIPAILNCSFSNELIITEIHSYYIDSYQIILGFLDSMLVSFFQTTVFPSLSIPIRAIYLSIIAFNLIHYIAIIYRESKNKESEETTYDRFIVFLTVAIFNPPWIDFDIFIDKSQLICKQIFTLHLNYKVLQMATICSILIQKQYTTLLQDDGQVSYILLYFIILGVFLVYNYSRSLIKLFTKQPTTNQYQDKLKEYYQLSYRNRDGDNTENQQCQEWILSSKLLAANQVQQELVNTQIEHLFHLFFKPGALEENEKMFKSNQFLFECYQNKMKLQYFNSDKLFTFALFCIYNFTRLTNETKLLQLPDIKNPDQVNAYFDAFTSVQNKIFGNQNIKEITLQSQLVFSKSIFVYKFFERILEFPLVKIVIFFDPQKYLQNYCVNRYRDYLQQFVVQIVLNRLGSFFDFNYKILLVDFFEDEFIPNKNSQKQQKIPLFSSLCTSPKRKMN